jgi:hypothetical protein
MSIPVYWESFLHVTVNHGKPLFIAKWGLNYVKYKTCSYMEKSLCISYWEVNLVVSINEASRKKLLL